MLKGPAPYTLLLAVLFLSSCSTLRVVPPGHASFEEGMALFNQGHFSAAIPHFQRATSENPQAAQAYLYLARSCISVGRWKAAIQPLRTAFRLAPEEAKDEIMNLILDAVFAAAINDPKSGKRDLSHDRHQELL